MGACGVSRRQANLVTEANYRNTVRASFVVGGRKGERLFLVHPSWGSLYVEIGKGFDWLNYY